MDIKIAREIGYCYGVRDAVDMAIDESAKVDGARVYTFGPVIHNRHTTEMLEGGHNVHVANEISDIQEPGATVVIRTHGTTSDKMKQLRESGFNVEDATCPFVLKTHRKAREFVEDGYFLVVLGHKHHPEVTGIVGQVPDDKVAIVDQPEDIDRFKKQLKIAAVFQSTVTFDEYEWAIPKLAAKCYDFKLLQTVCGVTITRQKRVEEVAREVELMIIIGGRNSSNTKKLVEVAEKHCSVLHIEEPVEVEEHDFAGVHSVGIGTGTSTPEFLVDEVVQRLRKKDPVLSKEK